MLLAGMRALLKTVSMRLGCARGGQPCQFGWAVPVVARFKDPPPIGGIVEFSYQESKWRLPLDVAVSVPVVPQRSARSRSGGWSARSRSGGWSVLLSLLESFVFSTSQAT